MQFKLFIVSFAITVFITSVCGLHNEHNVGPSVMAKPDVIWDNINAQDKFIKEKILSTTDVPSSDGEFAIKSEAESPMVSGGENPPASGENAPASGGENLPVSGGGNAPASGGGNSQASGEGNPSIPREGNVSATGRGNPPTSEGENPSTPSIEFAPPSDVEKTPFSQSDTETKEPGDVQPNLEPIEGPDNAQHRAEEPRIPVRSDIRHLQLMPGHNISYPVPPTIFPNHTAPGFGEHHPPGIHEYFDDRSIARRINITPIMNPNAPQEKDIAAADIDRTEKPKPAWNSDSDSPFSKFTGIIKGFFDAWAYKIQNFFKQ